jgi:hypothetical protein
MACSGVVQDVVEARRPLTMSGKVLDHVCLLWLSPADVPLYTSDFPKPIFSGIVKESEI